MAVASPFASADRERQTGELSVSAYPAWRHPSRLAIVVLAVVMAGCAAGRAFEQGEVAALNGDWDAAVAYFTQAVQDDPERVDYKIALERAMLNASRAHLIRAREFEARDELSAAALEYREASELDPSNQQAAAKVAELERLIRDRIEASRPRPAIEQMREQANQASAALLLNPASREPLAMQFVDANLRDVLDFIGDSTGINVTYDQQFQDRQYSVTLTGVTIEDALNQILSANQSFYKVVNQRTIIVSPDTPQKRAQYEEQVIRTFYVSHGDVQELSQLISTIIRVPQMAVQPMVAVNQTNNSITIRASTAVAAVIERILAANDKPLAEIVIDVEILEVNRERVRQFGLDLTQYANRRHLLARSRADRRGDPDRGPGPGVQPEHDLPRRQHGRLLRRRAGGVHPLSRDRRPDAIHRAAPAARAGGPATDAQSRRGDSGAHDRLLPDRHGRRGRESAHVVQLPAGRRHPGDDTACDLRG
tara:strand:+ start:345 stop:1784 length:1440 start_codon:yes stop_codon:yes gene_type:complete